MFNNNNQNFNNKQLLFENENTVKDNDSIMYNNQQNYFNQGIEQIQNNTNIPTYNPLFNQNSNNNINSYETFNNNSLNSKDFSSDQKNLYGQMNYDNLSNNDIPPQLDEIKNLNDAPISSAPTFDTLEPMNVMPETISPSYDDRLDAYEKGDFSLSNNANVYNSQLNVNIPNQNFDTNLQNSKMPFDNSNFLNQEVNQSDFNLDNQFISNSNEFNNSYDFSKMMDGSSTDDTSILSSFENSNPINNTHDLNNNLNTSNNNLSLNTNFESNLSQDLFLNNPINKLPTSFAEKDKSLDSSVSELKSLENNDKQEEKETSIDDKNVLNPINDDYSIQNLKMEDIYSEPDTLEIMDLDNDINSIENIQEKNELDDAIKELKSLVEKLKTQGLNIEIEEFDFETMYQLVVKINK